LSDSKKSLQKINNQEGSPAMKNFLVVAGCTLLLIYFNSHKKHITHFGPLPEPIQKELEIPVKLSAPKDTQIIGTNTYEITAMIVSRSRYYFDPSSTYSPVDFALAWGNLTTKENLDKISYSQWGRWYRTRYPEGVDGNEVSLHSANTHIIPEYGKPSLKNKLLDFNEGDVVKLKGYLVDINADSGFEWHSSLTRSDTGDGACEVFYVTEASLANDF
jgi:hypothetical protein